MELNADLIDRINEILKQDTSQLNSDNCNEALDKLYNKYKSLEESFIINLPKEFNDKSTFSKAIKELKKLKEKLDALRKDGRRYEDSIEKWKGNKSDTCLDEKSQIEEKVFEKICLERQLSYMECLTKLENDRLKRVVLSGCVK